MQETAQNAFGFAHLWAAGDVVSHTVAYILAAMSIASWYLILAKAWDWYRTRRAAKAVAGFWAATSVAEGIEKLRQNGEDSPYAQLAEQANCCNHECESVTGRLASRFDPAEQMERALRQQLMVTQAGMENGLTLLATTGATAPFVGLFGTVWGIMHSFRGLSNVGQATLSAVAPGIAEALVATAIGLFAAIPAVLAYNRFSHEIDRLATRFESFMEEFSNILQRQMR
jgi:biopolymer transport protein ExbB